MEKKISEKKKIKKGIYIVLIALISVICLTVVLWIFNGFFRDASKKPEALPSDVFYEADYEKNILEDPAYQRLDRSILYMEYDSGETLTEDNYTSIGVASEFFYKYFQAIINGDCDEYTAMLTENYVKDFDPPERFTMQMLYDIEVNQVQNVWTTTYQGQTATVYYFAVKYKIFENNGTFRNDVASNQSTTQYYELYSYGGSFYLNSFTNKMVIVGDVND